MKKITVMVLCLVLALSSAGCGSKTAESETFEKSVIEKAKDGDTTVQIEDIVYYNTKKAIAVEPDGSVIVNRELPLAGSIPSKTITAYAFISEEQLGDILVCLIDGEWYQFKATDRAGQP